MNRILVRFAGLPILAAVFATVPLAAQQYPAEPGDGVADMAGIIPPAAADSLRGILARLRADAGVEVRVLTVRNIARYETGDATPEAFATGVYNDWKLGYGVQQDGVLVMVSVDDRFARIELGDNVPAHHDARMQRIMDEQMVPRLRQGDYGGGVMDGVRAIDEAFRNPVDAALPRPRGGTPGEPLPDFVYDDPPAGSGNSQGLGAVMVGLIVLAVSWIVGSSYLRNRKRSCAHCGQPMQRLDESADDVFLDSGRRKEEVLGSVDYDVWQCTGCSAHTVLPYGSMLASHKKCPSCGYRTLATQTSVLERATYDSSGRERVRKDCRHCGWRDEDVVVLPRLVRHESSSRSLSSSGSGSSGGGSSSSGGGWSGGSGGGNGGGGGGGSSSGRGASGRW
ncbi:MAG TPA: TPM domain-containing protein [Longimicrobium sp.]